MQHEFSAVRGLECREPNTGAPRFHRRWLEAGIKLLRRENARKLNRTTTIRKFGSDVGKAFRVLGPEDYAGESGFAKEEKESDEEESKENS